ncbi:MAG: DUF4389 domain-containing protein [Syntrophobacteraceae bacterium]
MNEMSEEKIPRGKVAIRLIFTLICLIILHAVQLAIQAMTLLQYIILLITRSYSEPLRVFSNQAATYLYKLARYVTLNENIRPFPFSTFPKEIENPEGPVTFD